MSYRGTQVVLALGSNVGDRENYLRKAIESLRQIADSPIESSRVYETAPVGPGSQDPYLNLCVRFFTRMDPRGLLNFCQKAEREMGRIPRGRWQPREIDLDIIAYGREVFHFPDLVIPHPAATERQFVLQPLISMDPDYVLPGQGETVQRLMERSIERHGQLDMREYKPMPTTTQRIPEHVRYLAVEGVIGAGKTTLVRALSERLGCQALMEEFENNPFLSDFYRDRTRHAFQTQMFFLLSRHRQIQELFQQQDLFRPQVLSDYMFAKDRIFASLNLDENEMGLYSRLADLVERQLPRPDYVIYLQADTKTLMQRIRLRDRFYERNMDEGYIEALNQAYNTYFHHYSESPLLIVNTNHIDFVRRPDDLNLLVQQILKTPEGVTYFGPGKAA
jgi:deoxyguanosine kinase